MHSMPAITPNPAGTAIICQSLDNQVGAMGSSMAASHNQALMRGATAVSAESHLTAKFMKDGHW